MTFATPNKELKNKSTGMGFVDDVTLGCTSDTVPTDNDNIKETANTIETEVIEKITKMGQAWETMLHTNGGMLELKKCYWVLITWKWVRGIAKMKSVDDVQVNMNLTTTGEREKVTIERKSVQDAPKVLGCHVAADGNWSKEFGKWKTEARRFAQKVKQAHFSRTCGSRVYPSIWIARLRYISTAVCFTKKQSTQIDSPVVSECLRAAGFNKNFPRRVVMGPEHLGGMGWESSRSLQITEKIKFIITHLRRRDKIGRLLQIMIETLQLYTGLHVQILTTTIKWTRWVDNTWFTNVKEGLDAIKGELPTTFNIRKKPRQYDRSIMEIFNGWELKDKDMESINRCRVYLKVLYVSDVSNYEGTEIMEEAFEVRSFRHSTLVWPHQVRPTKSDRNIWRKHLYRLCYDGNKLITSLGRWINKNNQVWKFMICNEKINLLRTIDGQQRRLKPIGAGRFEKRGELVVEHESGMPVESRSIPIGYKITNDRFAYRPNQRIDENYEDKAHSKTVGRVDYMDESTMEREWMKDNEWEIGTDGGLKDGVGTGGVAIYKMDENNAVCTAMGAEECNLNSLHSTREELRANLMAEIILHRLNEKYGDDKTHKVRYICDSRSSLQNLETTPLGNNIIEPLAAEADLVMEIERLRQYNKNIVREYEWVKGHQSGDEKTRAANINDKADELATEGRNNVAQGLLNADPKLFYKGAIIVLKINNNIVTKDYNKEVTNALYRQDMLDYYNEKYGWSEPTMKTIDWDALGVSLKQQQGLHKVTITKLIHFWQPCNYYVQRNERRSEKFATCTECEELDIQFHYIMCKSEYFTQARQYAWKEFHKYMKKYNRNDTMMRLIWIGIQNMIYNDFNGELPKGDDVDIRQYEILVDAYTKQSEVGWNHLLVGRIVRTWGEYYRTTLPQDDKTDGRVIKFTRTMVQGFWKYSLRVWKMHNDINHGRDKTYSLRDIKTLQDCVLKLYDEVKESISAEDAWLFEEEARIKVNRPAGQLIGWLERVLLGLDEKASSNAKVTVKRIEKTLHRLCLSSIYN